MGEEKQVFGTGAGEKSLVRGTTRGRDRRYMSAVLIMCRAHCLTVWVLSLSLSDSGVQDGNAVQGGGH